MCGRYALSGEPDKIQKRFGIKKAPVDFNPNRNVAPGLMMPVILSEKLEEAVLAKWGLIPSWARDPKIGYKMINARAETLLEKPAFRKPFMTQRCLIPANGFYEWLKTDTDKIPYYIYLKNKDLFAMAGLYDYWRDAENRELLTFTIITTEPNPLVAKIHNRMPVILNPAFERNWLDTSQHDSELLKQMLTPYPEDKMESQIISEAINNP